MYPELQLTVDGIANSGTAIPTAHGPSVLVTGS